MDLLPNQLLRLVQIGSARSGPASEAIWKCVFLPDLLGAVSQVGRLCRRAGRPAAARRPSAAWTARRRRRPLFQQAFLDNIRRNGRLRELALIGAFKTKAFLRDGNFALLLKDALAAAAAVQTREVPSSRRRVEERRRTADFGAAKR